MSTDLTAVTGSPFDAIRITTPEGREYWSARELMPLLGYERWERFADAIDRAKVAAHNSGYNVAQNFPGAAKVSGKLLESYGATAIVEQSSRITWPQPDVEESAA